MADVIPAIIPKSFSDLEEKLSLVSELVSFVQIDVLDGQLTAEKSWPMIHIPDPDFSRIIKEEDSLPFWEKLDFEVDLMTLKPETLIDNWVFAGAARVIVHYESFPSADVAENTISEFVKKFSNKDSLINTEIGVALNIDTDISAVEKMIGEINFVQLMGIAHIGYQGEPFDERVLGKVRSLRQKYRELIISIDGGVNEESAPRLVEAGANRLVVGSALLKSDNIKGTYDFFKNL